MLDRDVSEKLSVFTIQISEKLNESIAFVHDHAPKESYESYRKVIATLIATLYLDIQERLWRDYPELRPMSEKESKRKEQTGPQRSRRSGLADSTYARPRSRPTSTRNFE